MTTESNARGGWGVADGLALEATCCFAPWLVPTVERFPLDDHFLTTPRLRRPESSAAPFPAARRSTLTITSRGGILRIWSR